MLFLTAPLSLPRGSNRIPLPLPPPPFLILVMMEGCLPWVGPFSFMNRRKSNNLALVRFCCGWVELRKEKNKEGGITKGRIIGRSFDAQRLLFVIRRKELPQKLVLKNSIRCIYVYIYVGMTSISWYGIVV